MDDKMLRLVESLSPSERKVLPFLSGEDFSKLVEESGLDRVGALRALEFLSSKKLVELTLDRKKTIDLGTNGVLYQKRGLPERQLIIFLEKGIVSLQEAQKNSKLSQNEFKAALGALKKKALIELKNGKIMLTGNRDEIHKKSLEERFLELLPLGADDLEPEQKFALDSLKERKGIVEIRDEQVIFYKLTELGNEVVKQDVSKMGNLLEELTPGMIKTGAYKSRKFRRYDVTSQVPAVYGGRKHFVNQATEYGRKVWTDMGFKEMGGDMIQSSFWVFDALFTAQDHPVREMQDTFFLKEKGKLLDKKLVEKVKKTHESGVDGSKGWQYSWSEEDAKKLVLRTHTTCLSARKLYELSKLPIEQRRGKFFAMGKNFRNETVDWSHGFEFYQTEGIVADPSVTFRHLLGYLQQFYKKMGFEKIRFAPGYFSYTEPSVEVHVWHPEKKVWLELGGAGVLRPEITIPLLGIKTPVLAWGQGFDRILMDYYEIKDLRELYKNDIGRLRKTRFWMK